MAGKAITVAAAISKEQLQQVAGLYGATNSGQFAGHPGGTLRLETFSGKYHSALGKFLGEYRFMATDTPTERTFSGLPGYPDPLPVKRGAKAVESDEEQANG